MKWKVRCNRSKGNILFTHDENQHSKYLYIKVFSHTYIKDLDSDWKGFVYILEQASKWPIRVTRTKPGWPLKNLEVFLQQTLWTISSQSTNMSFDGRPGSFYMLRMTASLGIHKPLAVIYGVVFVPHVSQHSPVCPPLITNNATSWLNMASDQRNKVASWSFLHQFQHQSPPFIFNSHHSKDPFLPSPGVSKASTCILKNHNIILAVKKKHTYYSKNCYTPCFKMP